jgi:hypothetical protein
MDSYYSAQMPCYYGISAVALLPLRASKVVTWQQSEKDPRPGLLASKWCIQLAAGPS